MRSYVRQLVFDPGVVQIRRRNEGDIMPARHFTQIVACSPLLRRGSIVITFRQRIFVQNKLGPDFPKQSWTIPSQLSPKPVERPDGSDDDRRKHDFRVNQDSLCDNSSV
jgi:hypothetical protein